MCSKHTMEYYSALKRKGVWHVLWSGDLKDIALSDISQPQKGRTLYDSTNMKYLEQSQS